MLRFRRYPFGVASGLSFSVRLFSIFFLSFFLFVFIVSLFKRDVFTLALEVFFEEVSDVDLVQDLALSAKVEYRSLGFDDVEYRSSSALDFDEGEEVETVLV